MAASFILGYTERVTPAVRGMGVSVRQSVADGVGVAGTVGPSSVGGLFWCVAIRSVEGAIQIEIGAGDPQA